MKFDVLGKIKNMSMRTKRIIALVICVSLLAVAIVQNMRSDKAEAGVDDTGDVNISVGGSGTFDDGSQSTGGSRTEFDVGAGVIKVNDAEEYFAVIRLNRLNSRSKTEESCNEIIESDTANESNVADAVAAMEDLRKTAQMETDLETAVKSRGYNDVFVSIENDSVYITVLADSLDEAEVSAIAASAGDITGYNLDEIVLKGVY